MKIIFITPYPFDEAPSQRFRFEQYLKYLKKNEVVYCISPFFEKAGWKKLYAKGSYLVKTTYLLKGYIMRGALLFKINSYDYIFIHREATPFGPPIFEWVVAKILRKKIIYDFDDAIWLEDPVEKGAFISKLKYKSKVRLICKWSHKISVGNNFLSKFAEQFNQNIVIIPTTIDTEYVHNPDLYEAVEKSDLTIGWTGTHSTMHYLIPIIPIIRELEKKHQTKFLVISNRKPDFNLNSLQFVPWSKATEIQDLCKIDIGLMPLTEDLWSQGKCGFKALQYMALRIPTVASPVGVNNSIIENEQNGYLCHNFEDWKHYLTQLILHKTDRTAVGNEARKTIIKYYSVSANKNLFLSLFNLEK